MDRVNGDLISEYRSICDPNSMIALARDSQPRSLSGLDIGIRDDIQSVFGWLLACSQCQENLRQQLTKLSEFGEVTDLHMQGPYY